MNKILTSFLCLFIFLVVKVNAQDNINRVPVKSDIFSFGLGYGFDYGGIGANATVYPQKNIGLFGGVGYAIAGLGYNTGIKLRLVSRKRFTPYVEAMYGYNAAIAVLNNSAYNKVFYGPSAGAGFDFGTHQINGGYFSFAVLVPFRSPDVNNYINQLKSEGVNFNNNLIPIGFSIGYRFVFL